MILLINQNCLQVLNAFEFEKHAGCFTKHPNNHIFLENGKTIYGLVQEVKSSPFNMLEEVIRTLLGGPISEKHLQVWKGDAYYVVLLFFHFFFHFFCVLLFLFANFDDM